MHFLRSKKRLKSFARVTPISLAASRGAALVFIAAAFMFLALSVINPQIFSNPRAFAIDLVMPVVSTVSKPIQDAASFVRNLSGISQMQAENARYKKENVRLKEWYQKALALQSENQSLRELLNVKIEPHYSFITARILADVGHSFARSLLVTAGYEDGVDKGQAVISGEGLVGRVIEASKKSSRVLLLTDINSRVPVLIEGSSQHAILAGSNDDLPQLIYLPSGSEVEEGAKIITSGFGGVFPKGLPVGKVTFGKDGKVPHVNLYADFNHMIYVRIVEQKQDPDLIVKTSE